MIILVILLALQAVQRFFTILFAGFLVGQTIKTEFTPGKAVQTRITSVIWMVVFILAAWLLAKAYL